MGIALAVEAFRRGADVTLVHGPLAVPLKVPRDIRCIGVTSAAEMQEAMLRESFDYIDSAGSRASIVIMAAAVADCRPDSVGSEKIKKGALPDTLALRKNPDILASLGERKGSQKGPLLVGFAVETGEVENLLSEVRRKLSEKNADLMVGNFANDAFDRDTNRVWLVSRSGKEEEVSTTYKSRIATRIFDAITRL
jgi:phosphopantothenoylcysteine decarboxylase/phosphopantothenate--cysteine ligase